MLLDHAQALAREGGLARLRLYANKLMSDNLAFCARRGFVVARVENYPGDEVVHMERALAR